MEGFQISFSLLSLAIAVPSTFQKHVTTSQVIAGDALSLTLPARVRIFTNSCTFS